MGRRLPLRATRNRALATWLALGILCWQTLFSAGAIEPLMAPLQVADGGIVICTEHGLQTLPSDGGAPVNVPTDHSTPPCPCCMPFAAGGSVILAQAPALAVPAWGAAPTVVPIAAAPHPRPATAGPQQPRAPPLPI